MDPLIKKIIILAFGLPVAMATFFGVIGFVMYRLTPIFDWLLNRADEEAKHISNPFWPTINTTEAAKIVARNTSEVTFIIAGATAILAIFRIFGTEHLVLIDSAVLIIIGLFIRKMSRIASVLGFCVYLTAKIIAFMQFPFLFGMNAIIFIVFLLVFINGIRATFKYHIIKKTEAVF